MPDRSTVAKFFGCLGGTLGQGTEVEVHLNG
jgi:hypothetical protein